MRKFFVEEKNIQNGKIEIDGSDVNHIKNVLRLEVGTEIEVCSKDTSECYTCKIAHIDVDKVECDIIEKSISSSEGNVILDIYQGLPKFDKMELIIQKGTELGVHRFIPVKMRRSIVKLDDKDASKKVERWNKISEVASKQSLRDIVPEVEMPIKINILAERIKDYDIVMVAYEEEKTNFIKDELQNLKNQMINNGTSDYKIAVLIGPEGGLDISEVNELKEAGARVVSLGRRILRTETASMQMASIIMYELENVK